ncbi:MAG: hypothetical protein ACE5PT_12470 [Gemmatimonadales bacterium]
MEDRSFTETDLRRMLQNAQDLRPDVVGGRWIVQTRYGAARWEVIVEPESIRQKLVVVTAYPVAR